MKRRKKSILIVLLAIAVTACLGSASVFASGNTYTIGYDSNNNIHSVKMDDGSEIIVFCMNNKRHWPHTTPSITSVPKYEQTSIEEFCRENGLTDSAKTAALEDRLKTILYAGYPYNGMFLYQLTSSIEKISEDQFDKLLNPPQSIRDDFPDSIGSRVFAYSDYKDQTDKMDYLKKFTEQVYDLYKNGSTTSSGLTYSDITATPFYGAVFCMLNSDDPLTAYPQLYGGDYFLTEQQAYSATSNAVWNLMKDYGIPDNSGVQESSGLSKSLKVAQSTGILSEKPSASKVTVDGDAVFEKNDSDGKWYTGTLTLKAPSTYNAAFNLILPDGITTTDGSTVVKRGDSFKLVSDTEPKGGVDISLSATIPWMEGDLIVFQAVGDTNNDFQNMVGARIHKEKISLSKHLSVAGKITNVTVTKSWEDESNKDGKRPTADEFAASIHLMNGDTEVADVTPAVTDNQDNTYTITYENLPLEDADGNEIQYTVKEDEVSGYSTDDATAENGETIVNTLKKDSGNTEDPKNPTDTKDPKKTSKTGGNDGNESVTAKTAGSIVKTGDSGNIVLYGSVLACAAALAAILVKIRKRNRLHNR